MVFTPAINTLEGVVLAGGLNSRFDGKIKAKFIIEDKPIIENALALLDKIFNKVSIVANDIDAFSEYGKYPIVSDIFKRVGPLGGIHSALANAHPASEAVFVIACDMPLLDMNLLRSMTGTFENSDCEVLIPFREGYMEPLHAIYSVQVLERLEEFLNSASSFAVRDFLEVCRVESFPIKSDNAFTNINTPEDLERFKSKDKLF